MSPNAIHGRFKMANSRRFKGNKVAEKISITRDVENKSESRHWRKEKMATAEVVVALLCSVSPGI